MNVMATVTGVMVMLLVSTFMVATSVAVMIVSVAMVDPALVSSITG